MLPSGDLLVAEDRSPLVSSALLVAAALGVFVISVAARDARLVTISGLEAAAPGALIAVALLHSHVGGTLDISVGGVFALLVVLLGSRQSPTDLLVIGVGVVALAAAVFSGITTTRTHNGLLRRLIVFFLFADVSLRLGGDTSALVDFRSSHLLRLAGGHWGSLPVGLMLAVGATVLVSLGLHHTDVGRRTRAHGSDPNAYVHTFGSNVGIRLAIAATVAGVLTVAAIVSVARLGISGTPSTERLLFEPTSAFVIGNGGLSRRSPSPGRVFATYLVLDALQRQLTTFGMAQLTTDLLVGALALVVLATARTRA